jgi:hypothetical protein
VARYANREFWQAVRRLREQLPSSHPVHVCTVSRLGDDLSGHIKMSYHGERRWTRIRIVRGTLTEMCDALAHEYAHLLNWSACPTSDLERKRMEHTAQWGASYAKCYRIVFETEN